MEQHTIAGTLQDPRFTRRYAREMFEQRYRVFHERLQWDVKCADGMERDQFDDAYSLYLGTADAEGRLLGSWRLRPTTQPYMLSDVFPQLLHGKDVPRHEDIWEISRFAADDVAQDRAFGLNETARLLVRDTIQLAVDNGIRQYVMVVSVAVERLLRNMGLKMHRFGPPVRIGRVLSVACSLDIDAQTRRAILGHVPELKAAA